MDDKIDDSLEIVILDDDKVILSSLETMFLKDRHPEERIHTFQDVKSLLDFASKTKRIHVAILDKNLGGGIKVQDEVIPDLRKKFAPLIIIVFTAFPSDEEEDYIKDLGVYKIMKKTAISLLQNDDYKIMKETIIRYQKRILAFQQISDIWEVK